MSPLAENDHTGEKCGDTPAQPLSVDIRSITRQPILDCRGRVHAYELLIDRRPSEEINSNGSSATRRILDDLVLFGFERLTSGLPTFVQCTLQALEDEEFTLLPPSRMVLEIPSYFTAVPKLLEACRRLKKAGFRLALKDFVWGPEQSVLLDIVDYVKADFFRRDAIGHRWLRARLRGSPAALVAENVHSMEAFRLACCEGFGLFQGFFFCDPQPLRNAKPPANRALHVQILTQLFREPLDLYALCPLVMRDPALVYRTLRLVNSPIYAIRQEVDSIQSAILILGETAFRRIAMLAIQCELNVDNPPEILRTASVRARFCELAAHHCDLDPNEQYLLGMLSLLPAMLQMPIQAIVPELPLRPSLRGALLGHATRDRIFLNWIESLERDDLSECFEIERLNGLSHDQLNRYFIEAVTWEAQDQGRPG